MGGWKVVAVLACVAHGTQMGDMSSDGDNDTVTMGPPSGLCADPAHYDANAVLTAMGGAKCGDVVNMMTTFSATEASCHELIMSGSDGDHVPRVFYMDMLSPVCCGGNANSCTQYLAEICPSGTTFDKSMELMGGNMTCGMLQGMMMPFKASPVTCHEDITLSGEMASDPQSRMIVMGMLKPCCGDAGTVCDAHTAKICPTGKAFMDNNKAMDPEKPGDGPDCGQMKTIIKPFTAATDTCDAMVPFGEGEEVSMQKLSMIMTMMGPCCDGMKTVCSDFGAQICPEGSDFVPNGQLDGTSCGFMVSMFAPFVADATTCAAEVTVKDSPTMTRMAWLSMMTGCCSGGQTVCHQFLPAVCKNAADFTPATKIPVDGSPTCAEIQAGLGSFAASQETCNQDITMGTGEDAMTMSANAVMGLASVSCCGGQASVCTEFGATPSPPTPAPVVVIETTAEPATAGATTLAIADVTGIEVGDDLTLSEAGKSETVKVAAVTVTGSRRLSGRRLAAGTVTTATPLENSYPSGPTVKVTRAAATPAPATATPAPATPVPATPVPATPAPATPAPATPAPTPLVNGGTIAPATPAPATTEEPTDASPKKAVPGILLAVAVLLVNHGK